MPSAQRITMEATISSAVRHGNSVVSSQEASINAAVTHTDILHTVC